MNTATPSVGSAASAAAPRDVSPIEAVTSQIGDAQQHTHTLITDLLNRLEPVLQAKVEKIGGASSPPAPPSQPSVSPLHGELVNRYDHATGINARLGDILDRLVVG